MRLRNAYIIQCVDVIKDDEGNVIEVHCTYDPESKSGRPGADRKVKGTIHWVSAVDSVTAEVRLFDRLFSTANPNAEADDRPFTDWLNDRSLTVIPEGRLEPGLAELAPGAHVQFERLGYFVVDSEDSAPGRPIFNRVVTLRDSWARIEKAELGG